MKSMTKISLLNSLFNDNYQKINQNSDPCTKYCFNSAKMFGLNLQTSPSHLV